MVEAGPAVGGWRTLIEDPGFGARPQLDRAFEDSVFAPSGQLVGFEGSEINF